MTVAHPRWLSGFERGGRPIYLALVAAMEAAIRSGELQPGDQLPPQRVVADALGIDLTTVTRAYRLASETGLTEGSVGRGTFVRTGALEDEAGLVDLSMNIAPAPVGVSLGAVLADTTSAILQRSVPATLLAYHAGAGTRGQKAAGAAWLAPCLGEVAPERVLLAPGAQAGLAAILSALCRPGDAVIVEPLTYPGVIAIARQFGLRLIPCPTDADGLIPEALDEVCRQQRPVAIYLVPTMQNPTAVTTTLERRQAIAALGTAHDLWIVEDDPYSRLTDTPLAAVATLAPERTCYLATLSKCLSPGLRTAFIVCPRGDAEVRVGESLRALSLMPAPLMSAVFAAWFKDGTAEALLRGVRTEARARRALVSNILPTAKGSADGIHVWLDLPRGWSSEKLLLAAQRRGLSLVAAEAFAAGPDHANGVRISLGGPSKRAVLGDALTTIAGLIADAGAPRGLVV